MRDDDYDYDYHNLAENADELYNGEYYYDDGTNEPWAILDDEDEVTDDTGWDNYYHNITDEIDDD